MRIMLEFAGVIGFAFDFDIYLCFKGLVISTAEVLKELERYAVTRTQVNWDVILSKYDAILRLYVYEVVGLSIIEKTTVDKSSEIS